MSEKISSQEPVGDFFGAAVKAGEKVPDFELENFDGSTLRLRDELVKDAVLLVFYRGHW